MKWKEQCPYEKADWRRKLYFFAIIQFAMVQGDPTLDGPISTLFIAKDSKGAPLDSAKNIARSPMAVIKFFRAKAKRVIAALEQHPAVASSSEYQPDKGFNHWFAKAKAYVFNCKKVCIRFLAKAEGTTEMVLIGNENLQQIMSPDAFTEGLPKHILDRIPDNQCFFPPEWDEEFFTSLYRVGLKSAFLCAESMYGLEAGPALDCHMIRWMVSFGVLPGLVLSSMEKSVDYVKRVIDNRLFAMANETPGSIAQLLHRRRYQKLCDDLFYTASQLGLGPQMSNYLRMYPQQSLHDL